MYEGTGGESGTGPGRYGAPVDVLFLGGTGLIGSACARFAVEQGHDVTVVNRGRTRLAPAPAGVREVRADVRDSAALRAGIAGRDFDSVVQWIGFTPAHVAPDVELFAGAGQYVFISSASAYEKPPSSYVVSESTPLRNPYWQYSRDKLECERLLFDAHASTGFPVTVVRPSLTYGPSQVPVSVGSWDKPYTIIDRMRRGAPILVPGDGTSLWVLTHNSDVARGLVGLLGLPGAVGEAVHVTSDEVLTWNDIYCEVGRAAGVEPRLLHVPTDFIVAADPGSEGSLRGDKSHSLVFDNSKLRSLVPSFEATVPFSVGIRDTVRWFDDDVARQAIDADANALWDRIAAAYGEALRLVARGASGGTG